MQISEVAHDHIPTLKMIYILTACQYQQPHKCASVRCIHNHRRGSNTKMCVCMCVWLSARATKPNNTTTLLVPSSSFRSEIDFSKGQQRPHLSTPHSVTVFHFAIITITMSILFSCNNTHVCCSLSLCLSEGEVAWTCDLCLDNVTSQRIDARAVAAGLIHCCQRHGLGVVTVTTPPLLPLCLHTVLDEFEDGT